MILVSTGENRKYLVNKVLLYAVENIKLLRIVKDKMATHVYKTSCNESVC